MPVREEAHDEIRNLIVKASQDIEAAEDLMPKADGSQHDNVGQHLRQAVEMTAKALALANGALNIPRSGQHGHNVANLFEMAEDAGSAVAAAFDALVALKLYDSHSRYDHVLKSARLDLRRLLPQVKDFHGAAVKEILAMLGGP
jgi:hypothetical protein